MKNIIKYILGIAILISSTVYSQNLDLDSCKVLALENNISIKNSMLELEASKQVKKYAFTKFFPHISASGFAMKANDYMIKQEIPQMNLPVYDGNPANLVNPTQFTYFPGMHIETLDYINIANITAVQPVFFGGKIINSNKLAKLNVELHEDKLGKSTGDILMQTENYYWKIVSLKEKRTTLDSYENLLESLLNDVSTAHEAGLVEKSDLLKVQMKISEVEVKRLQLENGISLLKMAFCQHLGVEYNADFDLSDSLIIEETPSEAYTKHDDALFQRKEYAMLNKAVEAETLNKRIETAEHLPQIAVGVQGLYLDVIDQQDAYGLAFGTITIPISDWWGGSHKTKEHKIKIEIAKNNLHDKSELMILQMEKNFNDLNETYELISLAQSSVDQAMEHHKVMEANYSAGIASTSDMLEAQALLQDNDNKLVEAKSNYKIKLLNYKKSIGKF